jgi:hypothetical protein
MMEAGESEYSGLLKTLNLLIFREAKNAEHGRIAANWNVSGTRNFQPAVQICEEFASPLSTSYPRVSFACRPNFPEVRLSVLIRRSARNFRVTSHPTGIADSTLPSLWSNADFRRANIDTL